MGAGDHLRPPLVFWGLVNNMKYALIVVAFWFVISGALAQAQTACDTNCTAPAGGEVLALAGPADATLTYLLSINGTSALFANATIYFNSQPVGSLSFVNGDAVFDFVNGPEIFPTPPTV